MDKYSQAITTILKEQEQIVGTTIAMTQARKVPTLKIENENQMSIQGDPKETLSQLVENYSELFGQASIEVCKRAIQKLNPPLSREELPDILK